MNENRNLKKGVGIHARRLIAYIVLIIVSILCLFWFYVLFINATRSNGELQSGFTLVPEQPSVGKLEEFEKWNASGMERYVQQPDRFFAQCSTQRIFFNDDSLCDPCI